MNISPYFVSKAVTFLQNLKVMIIEWFSILSDLSALYKKLGKTVLHTHPSWCILLFFCLFFAKLSSLNWEKKCQCDFYSLDMLNSLKLLFVDTYQVTKTIEMRQKNQDTSTIYVCLVCLPNAQKWHQIALCIYHF